MDPEIGRRTWRTLEPIHGAIYFASEAQDEYTAIGLADRMAGYFASRSAAMGGVGPDVVIATFFNFAPDLVRRSMRGVWDAVAPDVVLAARLRAADRMLRRLAPDAPTSEEVERAAALARRAAEAASERPEGRPLFAGHAALDWPDDPHLVLWHAQTLLREFRGDGHVAALVAEGLDGCSALVTHAAAGDVPAAVLRSTRERSDDEWAAAEDRLRSRGWLDDDGRLTTAGRDVRERIERRTDELAVAPYAAIGTAACADLRRLARPTSRAMTAVFSVPSRAYQPDAAAAAAASPSRIRPRPNSNS